MANGDYGYFGKGDTGYAQYMTAFPPKVRKKGKPSFIN